jgi:UDPglucose 6-dehydrogenase
LQTVSIIGLGFVGLSTAVVFASRSIRVIGVEKDDYRFRAIQSGKPHFYEPKLESMLNVVLKKGLLRLSKDVFNAVRTSKFTFITVGTPALSNGTVDLSYIKQAAIEIGNSLSGTAHKYHVVVVKSTVPPGTTESVVAKNIMDYSKKALNEDFGIASNPEFLKEGSAIGDSLYPHILVIGSSGPRTKAKIVSLYKSIYGHQSQPELIETNIRTAELIKYANNSFLATKISFITTMANICSRIPDVDVEVVAKAIGLDPRIGRLFLRAGPGYGGSCLPKDVAGLINFSKTVGYDPIILESAQRVNETRPAEIFSMILNILDGTVDGKIVSILGLAFKKDTDDIRESISLKVIIELRKRGAIVKAHDPMAIDNAKKVFGDDIEYYSDKIHCIMDTDCCVIMTEWDEYKELNQASFKKYMKRPNVVDARRLLDPTAMNGINLSAVGLG